MSKLHRLLLYPALAIAGIVLTVPVAAQTAVAPGPFADESAGQPTGLAMMELQDQGAGARQELDNKHTAASSDRQPASASSNSGSNNSSASAIETKDKKNKTKDKRKANPAPSDQDEKYKRELLGIYG